MHLGGAREADGYQATERRASRAASNGRAPPKRRRRRRGRSVRGSESGGDARAFIAGMSVTMDVGPRITKSLKFESLCIL